MLFRVWFRSLCSIMGFLFAGPLAKYDPYPSLGATCEGVQKEKPLLLNGAPEEDEYFGDSH